MKKIGLTLLAGASLLLLLHVATVAESRKCCRQRGSHRWVGRYLWYRWSFQDDQGTSLVSMLT